jgi:predicted dehydrogenase
MAKVDEPLRIGLVGAGPWAGMFHAPMLARSPAVELVGVWGRRPEAAGAIAERRKTVAFEDLDALIGEVEALAFAVPPDVQGELGARAAAAGRHLLLEKPLGLDLETARRLADAVGQAGVRTQMVLTRRYLPRTVEFLVRSGSFTAYGGRAVAISGAVVEGGPFATPWRLEHGALIDVGPHVIDLLDAALGPVTDITATGDPRRFVTITARHRDGAVSQAALSVSQPGTEGISAFELYGPDGVLTLEEGGPAAGEDYAAAMAAIPQQFAECVRSGVDHPLDVHRGLYLQGLLERAARSLG